jgi:hypothetical protein
VAVQKAGEARYAAAGRALRISGFVPTDPSIIPNDALESTRLFQRAFSG